MIASNSGPAGQRRAATRTYLTNLSVLPVLSVVLAGGQVAAELLAKPRPRCRPRALHGLARDAQRLRGFVEREAREDPALDHAMGALVNLRQPFEGDIDRQHLFDLDVAEEWFAVFALELDGAIVTATLQTRSRPRVIDQDPPHRLRGDRQEIVAVRRGQLTLVQEPEVHLVNERRGRERVIGRFPTELPTGDLTQLVVDERYEPLEGFTIARAPARKPFGDLSIGRHG